MKVGAPKEVYLGERRVAITPSSAVQMQKLGHECIIEMGAGLAAGFSDEAYKEAGVKVLKSAAALWKASDIVIKVRDPIKAEQKFFRDNQTLISFFNNRLAMRFDSGLHLPLGNIPCTTTTTGLFL